MGPFDYTVDVVDPIEAALQGRATRFAEGQQVRAADQQDVSLGQGQQRIDMAQEQMMFQRQEAERARAEQAQAKAQAEAGQKAYVDFMFAPNKTAEMARAVIEANPEMGQAVMEFWQGQNADQQASELSFAKQFGFALNQSPDAARAMLEDRADRAEAIGDQAKAATYRSQAQLMAMGEDGIEAVKAQTLAVMAGVMEPKELQSFMEVAGYSQGEYKPLSEMGQIESDFREGAMSADAYQMELQRRAPKESRVYVGPDNSVTITEGVAGSSGEPTIGEVYNPAEVQSTLDLINEIKEDKALPKITGPIEGGGGNDVEDFGFARRVAYGSDGIALVEKMNQLQSRSWLAARAMLKGGGPITDYESRKAEAAVARLSRTKDHKDYLAALGDLESAITDGMKKLEAAKGGNSDELFMTEMRAKAGRGEKPTPEDAARYREIKSRQGGN